MKLSELIRNLEIVEIIGDTNIKINEITTKSNKAVKDSLYVCLVGGTHNGHDYIHQAEQYGAKVIITEEKRDCSVTQIIVKDTRKALSIVAGNFYNNAHKNLKIIGVTGTNGKTTTTHYVTSILANNGKKCGLIGTLGIFYAGKSIENNLTTPDPLDLHKTFYDMAESGIEYVIMEISAHAIYYNKIYGIDFETLVFTNCTQDHLDFFMNMQEYRACKKRLFTDFNTKYIVTNADDELGRELIELDNVISYGLNNPCDNFAINVKQKNLTTKFTINLFDRVYNVVLDLIGEYNVYNALAGATVCALLGINTEKVVNGLEMLKGVNGRLECVYQGAFDVFIDYAHTPDGLKKSLSSLKKHCNGKLISVFGCGGNRDADKRKIMGEISGEIADFTVITSDNPRFEEPMDIIYEIEKGVLKNSKSYVCIEDRIEAISYAINMAKPADVVLIAGKGGEKYQEVFGIKRFYNDKDTVEDIIKGIKN